MREVTLPTAGRPLGNRRGTAGCAIDGDGDGDGARVDGGGDGDGDGARGDGDGARVDGGGDGDGDGAVSHPATSATTANRFLVSIRRR